MKRYHSAKPTIKPIETLETQLEGQHQGGPSQQNKEGKAKYPREKKDTPVVVKGNNINPTSRNHDNKCFYCLGFSHIALQCPNKNVMVMKANNEVETDEEDEEEKMPPLEDADDVYVEYLVEGETLVVRRTLNIHVKVNDSKCQRENILQRDVLFIIRYTT